VKQPHKHAALIKAWVDGAEIEYWNITLKQWRYVSIPGWLLDTEYRIKPKDKIFYKYLTSDGYCCSTTLDDEENKPTLKLTLDRETGKLKSAEVIND